MVLDALWQKYKPRGNERVDERKFDVRVEEHRGIRVRVVRVAVAYAERNQRNDG